MSIRPAYHGVTTKLQHFPPNRRKSYIRGRSGLAVRSNVCGMKGRVSDKNGMPFAPRLNCKTGTLLRDLTANDSGRRLLGGNCLQLPGSRALQATPLQSRLLVEAGCVCSFAACGISWACAGHIHRPQIEPHLQKPFQIADKVRTKSPVQPTVNSVDEWRSAGCRQSDGRGGRRRVPPPYRGVSEVEHPGIADSERCSQQKILDNPSAAHCELSPYTLNEIRDTAFGLLESCSS